MLTSCLRCRDDGFRGVEQVCERGAQVLVQPALVPAAARQYISPLPSNSLLVQSANMADLVIVRDTFVCVFPVLLRCI